MEVRLDLSPRPGKVAGRLAAALVGVLALGILGAPALADGGDADELFAKAVAQYQAKEYAEAAALFAGVYALRPSIDVHFAWAQAERFADNCPRALELFDQLLGKKLTAANRRAVSQAVKSCRARVAELEAATELEAERAAEREAAEREAAEREADRAALEARRAEAATPEPEPENKRVEPRVASAEPSADLATSSRLAIEPESDAGPWYTDPIGGALVGAGLVGVGAGVGFLVLARSADRDAGRTESYAEFLELTDRAESRGRIGVIGVAAGGALVAAGIAWYVFGAGDEGDDGAGISGWLEGQGGGGLTLSARF